MCLVLRDGAKSHTELHRGGEQVPWVLRRRQGRALQVTNTKALTGQRRRTKDVQTLHSINNLPLSLSLSLSNTHTHTHTHTHTYTHLLLYTKEEKL